MPRWVSAFTIVSPLRSAISKWGNINNVPSKWNAPLFPPARQEKLMSDLPLRQHTHIHKVITISRRQSTSKPPAMTQYLATEHARIASYPICMSRPGHGEKIPQPTTHSFPSSYDIMVEFSSVPPLACRVFLTRIAVLRERDDRDHRPVHPPFRADGSDHQWVSKRANKQTRVSCPNF